MRGYTFSFRVRFLDQPESKRTAWAAATEAIKRGLCSRGEKQRYSDCFTLDARENSACHGPFSGVTPCLEGVIEGVNNGAVSKKAHTILKKQVYN